MNVASINTITVGLTFYTPYVMLVLGNISCVCNFMTFTSKQLRRNSCGWYFFMSAIFDFAYINFGLISKLASDQYRNTLQNTSLAYCRLRVFFTWTLPCISTGFFILAALDRCLSTSQSARLRSFSQIKIAHRMTCVPIILYSLTTSHQFYYYDLRPTCAPLAGSYALFLSIYSIAWTSLVPQGIMLVLGLITYLNVRKSHQRLIRQAEQKSNQQHNRTDRQLITITLVQVLCSSILLNIRTAYYSYTVLSTSLVKDSYRRAIETLLLQISSFIFYFNFVKNFFINTLSSKLFRKVFCQRLIIFYHFITPWKVRIHPETTLTLAHVRSMRLRGQEQTITATIA